MFCFKVQNIQEKKRQILSMHIAVHSIYCGHIMHVRACAKCFTVLMLGVVARKPGSSRFSSQVIAVFFLFFFSFLLFFFSFLLFFLTFLTLNIIVKNYSEKAKIKQTTKIKQAF